MNIKNLIKNKYLWVGISTIIFIILIFIMTNSQSSSSDDGSECPKGQQSYKCSNGESQCAIPCPTNQKWNCNSHDDNTAACVCKTGTLCENKSNCCINCNNDLCCDEDQQITVDGKNSCCPAGTIPNSDKNACMSKCGNGYCGVNQECLSISNIPADSFNEFDQTANNWRGYTQDSSNGKYTVHLCEDKSKCSWGSAIGFPSSVSNAWPYYNIRDNVCLPKTNDDTSCYNLSEDACNKKQNCEMVDVLQAFSSKNSDDFINKMQSLFDNNKTSNLGYYCDGTGASDSDFLRLYKETGTGDCSWSDCYKQLSNTGSTQILYTKNDNDNGGVCTSLNVPDTEIEKGITMQQACTDVINGVPCNACIGKKVGEMVTCPSTSQNTNKGWSFEKCIKDDNNTQLKKYTAIGGGNCPWGCENSSCETTEIDNNIIIGQSDGANNRYCATNDQIINWTKPGDVAWICDTNSKDCIQGTNANTTYKNQKGCRDTSQCIQICSGDTVKIILDVSNTGSTNNKLIISNGTSDSGARVEATFYKDNTTYASFEYEFTILAYTKDKNNPQQVTNGTAIEPNNMNVYIQQTRNTPKKICFKFDQYHYLIYEECTTKNLKNGNIFAYSKFSEPNIYYNTTYGSKFYFSKHDFDSYTKNPTKNPPPIYGDTSNFKNRDTNNYPVNVTFVKVWN